MITTHEASERHAIPAAAPRRGPTTDDPFDPVFRAVMACDGIGREKTIALVLSAVESAFPR